MSDSSKQLLQLPVDVPSVELRCLDGGSFIAEASKVHAGANDETFRMYNWAFYIKDLETGRQVMWDLGISGKTEHYTPWVQKYMLSETKAVGPRQSICEQLAKINVKGNEIDSVLFSHAHWDHCRPIDWEFPTACAFFGPGTSEHCSPGHLISDDAKETVQWDGRYFDSVRQNQRWKEFSGPWVRFGAFEKVMDFFGNGSFWVAQAPGHMLGNLCAVAHVGNNQWILLGSDCCHSRLLFDGIEQFAVWKNPDGCFTSLQADIPAAKDTIRRIKLMEEELGCHIAFAHDTEWMKTGSDQVLMGTLDDDMKKAVKERLPFQEVI